jgi:hypothetical protein
MRTHAEYVLGVQVLFKLNSNVLLCETMPSVPRIDAGKYKSNPSTSELPAMLLPRAAEMFTIYIDKQGGLFARAQDSSLDAAQDGGFFVLQERWCALTHALPPDSTCRVMVYRDRSGRLVMGVFDLTKLAGVDQTAETVFARQEALFSLWRDAAAPTGDVEHHWVGMEGSLLEHLKDDSFLRGLPFDVDNMLRMSAPATYQLVLRPLRV